MKAKVVCWSRVPSLVLAAALQVMPLVRAAVPVAETTANVLAIVFRWAAGAAAALGNVQAVSGASTLITNPLSTNITEGVSFTLRLTTAPNQAHYWTATGLPAGLSLSGTSGQTLWQITGTSTVTGTYSVGLTAKDQATSGADRTVTATLVINISQATGPPAITAQPASLSVAQGQSATFSVTASGTAPLSYQWRFQSANLSGQTASTLVINPVTTNNAGNYNVVVSNGSGSVTSAVATLTILVPPAIITPPASQTVTQAQTARFSVAATGTAPLSYQWSFQSAALSGQTGTTLTINSATTNNAGNYNVVVSNSAGSVTSAVATLTVIVPLLPPTITTPPSSLSVTQNQSASFSVVAGGAAPLNYQWRFQSAALSGQTGSTLLINPATTNNAGDYDVIVGNSVGSVTSAVATLTVIVPGSALQILSQPASQTVTQGQAAVFSIQAGGVAPLSYQWRFNGVFLSGQTATTLRISGATTNNAGGYDAVVSNSSGSVTSAVATLTVLVPPTILLPPASQTATQGSNVTFSVSAGGTAPLSFYWRKDAAVVAGPAGPSFSITGVQSTDAGSYSVIVSNAAGTALSASATLAVVAPPAAPFLSVQPADQTVVAGNSAMFQVVAGGSAPLTYQWLFNGAPMEGGNGPVLSLPDVQAPNAGAYSVLVSNPYGSVASVVARLALATMKGVYNGLYYDPADLSALGAGSFTATVTDKGKYSGSVTLLAYRYPFSGQFDSTGRGTNEVARGGLKRWSLELAWDGTNADQIQGRITDGTWSAEVLAERSAWNAKTNPAPQAGTYTLVIPGVPGGGRQNPEGSGYARIKVSLAGGISFSGTLADGRRLIRGGKLSNSGAWPLYAPLYRGEGALLGWLTFTNRGSDDVNGLTSWTKLQQPLDPDYPAGFSVESQATGSRYQPPAPGTTALAFAAGQVVLTGGILSQNIANPVTLESNNKTLSSDGSRLTLVINPRSGLFQGSTINPATGKPIRFEGALLQKQNAGWGSFFSGNCSGQVYFGP